MTEFKSPSGEVLDIPTEGEAAIRALGWEPVKPKQAPTKAAPTSKRK